jgi:lipoprotein NlpD
MRRRARPGARLRAAPAVALLAILAACGSAPARPGGSYVVRPGDTLYSIAWRHGLDYHELARLNGIGRDYRITPGETLRLSARTPVPRPAAPQATAAAAAAAPAGMREAPLPVTPAPQWVWPADGVAGAALPRPSGGVGLEIAGEAGGAVRAAAAGRVVYTGAGLRGYGQLVIIKHDESWLTAYGYNQALEVHEGEVVSAGERIATMGEGPAHRPTLYFEIRQNGRPVDPLQQLPRRP